MLFGREMIKVDIAAILVAMSIPSAITGFCFWGSERKITSRDKKADIERQQMRMEAEEREKNREKYEICLLKTVNASIALGEATARAVQRIPDANCNGDMHAALEYATKVKHEQKDFLERQAIESLQD